VLAGALAAIGAKLVADGILRDVETISDGLFAVGRGKRDVSITTAANDELGELAEAANAMIADLQAQETARDQSDRARRDLVAAVSHDLRTPITSLRLLAEAVDDEIVVDVETRRIYLQRMRTHIDALSALIDDLFELSRLEAGDIGWSLERVPLHELVAEMLAASCDIRCMRDPTRGGLSSTLNELAEQSGIGIFLDERKILIREEVKGACEMLGLDPLYVANEGKLVAIVAPESADAVLAAMRHHPLGKNAQMIGEVTNDSRRLVTMRTVLGTTRIVDMLAGDQLPRIC